MKLSLESIVGLTVVLSSKTWEDLDHPIYIQTGPNKEDILDGVEEFFTILYHQIRSIPEGERREGGREREEGREDGNGI